MFHCFEYELQNLDTQIAEDKEIEEMLELERLRKHYRLWYGRVQAAKEYFGEDAEPSSLPASVEECRLAISVLIAQDKFWTNRVEEDVNKRNGAFKESINIQQIKATQNLAVNQHPPLIHQQGEASMLFQKKNHLQNDSDDNITQKRSPERMLKGSLEINTKRSRSQENQLSNSSISYQSEGSPLNDVAQNLSNHDSYQSDEIEEEDNQVASKYIDLKLQTRRRTNVFHVTQVPLIQPVQEPIETMPGFTESTKGF